MLHTSNRRGQQVAYDDEELIWQAEKPDDAGFEVLRRLVPVAWSELSNLPKRASQGWTILENVFCFQTRLLRRLDKPSR